MAVHSYEELLAHVGHDIEIATYGDPEDPENVALECMDCYTVLVDYDRGESDY